MGRAVANGSSATLFAQSRASLHWIAHLCLEPFRVHLLVRQGFMELDLQVFHAFGLYFLLGF